MNAILFALALNLVNANVQSLPSINAAPANGWIGYTITAREPLYVTCDRCSLSRDGGFSLNSRDPNDIGPVGDTHLLLFARLENGVVERIRIFSPGCAIDGAGQSVHWIDNVPRDASIAFLRSAVERGEHKARGGALLALSLHEGATGTLIDLARNNPDRDIRGKALFWLSQQAGRKAADALKDAVENDPEESVRAKAVFGISQLPNDQSIPLLIDLVKNNRSREVRKKAAFWLGQKDDPRALAALAEILAK